MEPNPFRKLKNAALAASASIIMAVPAFGQNQEKAPITPKVSTETLDSTQNDREKDPFVNEAYVTRDGNYRHYHNPKSGFLTPDGNKKVSYSFGATENPYKNLQDIKDQTPVPQSLTETDFFTNYINAKIETDHVKTDTVTGNSYYDFTEYTPSIVGVDYEGDKHWNVNRFLINPHFKEFHIKKDQAEMNAMHDIYRYFLYIEKGDREKAWDEAHEFMTKEVDPIIKGKWNEWYTNRGYELFYSQSDPAPDTSYFIETPNLFNENDQDYGFVKSALMHNRDILTGARTGTAFTEQEIEDALTNYNIEYRKKTPEEARAIAKKAILKEQDEIKTAIEKVTSKPLVEYKVIQEGAYPENYSTLDPVLQEDWNNQNPDKVRIVQEAYTNEDRQKELEFYQSLSFAK